METLAWEEVDSYMLRNYCHVTNWEEVRTMEDKEQKPAEPVATGKLPWRKLTLQKLLTVDQTSSNPGTGGDAQGRS